MAIRLFSGWTRIKRSSPKSKDAPAPTLADQQTVREIERLFGRAFRHGGAQLADQQVAASLLPDEPGTHLVGDRAAKDRMDPRVPAERKGAAEETTLEELYAAGRDLGLEGYELERFVENAGAWA